MHAKICYASQVGAQNVLFQQIRGGPRETRGGYKLNLLEPGYFWIPLVGKISRVDSGESPLVMYCIKKKQNAALAMTVLWEALVTRVHY